MNKKTKNFYVKKMQKYIIVLCGVLVFASCLAGCTPKEEDDLLLLPVGENIADNQIVEAKQADEPEPVMICIHICGAVNNPGVYRMPEGSRIYEVIEEAGGFSETACRDYVNLAQTVSDESRIVIPTAEEVEEGSIFAHDYESAISADNGLVNINTATVEELCTLPGIGESKAKAIVDYRNSIGQYESIEQIMEVAGIKSGMYSKIQDKICVR